MRRSFHRFRGGTWAGWTLQLGRLWLDFRAGRHLRDRILTITWDGK